MEKRNPSNEFRHFDYCSQDFKKNLKDKKKCEEGNMICHRENVPKGHIIHSNQNNTWNVNRKYHTTTYHTKRHMKIHTRKNLYHCSLCAKKSISRSRMKIHARENLNPYALCEREVVGEPLKETQ